MRNWKAIVIRKGAKVGFAVFEPKVLYQPEQIAGNCQYADKVPS
jgi:hypothetical protein